MRRCAWFLGLALGMSSITGCVDRRFVVNSDPPGALVLRNGKPIGVTPVDDHFVYYGNYHFTLIKDGYQTLQVDQKIPTPWYEYFPLEIISENLWPWRIVDRRQFNYQLEPIQAVRTDELLNQAQILRDRGKAITPPPETPPSGQSAPIPQPPKSETPPPEMISSGKPSLSNVNEP